VPVTCPSVNTGVISARKNFSHGRNGPYSWRKLCERAHDQNQKRKARVCRAGLFLSRSFRFANRTMLGAETESLSRIVPEDFAPRFGGDSFVAADRAHGLLRKFIDGVAMRIICGNHQVIVADMFNECGC
jgi:hypothetical protein